MDAIKFERTQIHFFTVLFTAVVVVLAYGPSFMFDNGDFFFSLTYRRMFRFQTKPDTCGRDLRHLR